MNGKAPLLVALFTLASAPAWAHHHHFHHHFSAHSSSSHSSLEDICLRWAEVPADAGLDAGVDDSEAALDADAGDDFDDGGVEEPDDAGTPPAGTVRVCVERMPGFGCSTLPGAGGLLPLAALALLAGSQRRRALRYEEG